MSVPVIPRSFMRLQMHKGFDFEQARKLVPYFAKLGVSHLYSSPILTARAGSMHGYDVVDHGAVNPELGGEDGLRALVAELRRHNMGLLVDIVPNHVAVGEHDNAAWLDVLEWGRASRYATFFDIDWDVPDPAINNKILAPFLGKPYGEALADGEIKLVFDTERGRFRAEYYDHWFPIAPRTYGILLRSGPEALHPFAVELRRVAVQQRGKRGSAFDEACKRLAQAARDDASVREAIDALLARYDASTGEGRTRLHGLLERQHYRLAWWRTAGDEINWRRFFDVISLAGVRIQEPATFEIVHATTFRLYAEGLVDGVRVDHVDGLADPRSYCRRLRARLRSLARQRPDDAPKGPAYFVVEKILAPRERLARDWQIDGTTGYTFMNEVGALLHDPNGEDALSGLWERLTGRTADFEAEERRARRRTLQELLAADFNACAHALHTIARSRPQTRDFTLFAIRRVLLELLVAFPVYRIYADARGRSAEDDEIMARTIAAAEKMVAPGDRPLLDVINRWLGGEAPVNVHPVTARRQRLRAIARFQQLSSPVAAKSVEDTAFYRHGRLLSRNEVGAHPGQFAMSVEEFHAENRARLSRFPLALLTTATHDHKRGEDLRARLTVISERPGDWAEQLQRWLNDNASLKTEHKGVSGPDATDEIMLYQMLVGAWPLDLSANDAKGLAAFRDRIAGWQEKAIREAKRLSGWIEPNLEYEQATREFLFALLDPQRSAGFLGSLQSFAEQLAPAGAVNGLAQTLLRVTAPGIPDCYQGCEFWDFSLVDPDNRRPVDFEARKRGLDSDEPAQALLPSWRDGRIKQRLIARALHLRQQMPEVFAHGEYLALEARGELARHVVAYARRAGEQVAIAITARFVAGLVDDGAPHIDPGEWSGTSVVLPQDLRGRRWRCMLTGVEVGGDSLPLAEALAIWPCALLVPVAG